MRKVLLMFFLAGLLLGATALNSAALTTDDGISFAGGAVPNNFDYTDATRFLSFPGVTATSPAATGVFAPIVPGTPVTWNGFTFAPFSPVTPLWTVTVGGKTYSFDATTLDLVTRGPLGLFIDLRGSGIVPVTGLANSNGTWVLSANSAGLTSSFSASTATQVPEPSGLILLGAGLLAAVGFRRKILD